MDRRRANGGEIEEAGGLLLLADFFKFVLHIFTWFLHDRLISCKLPIFFFLFQMYCNTDSKMPHWCLRNTNLIKVKVTESNDNDNNNGNK